MYRVGKLRNMGGKEDSRRGWVNGKKRGRMNTEGEEISNNQRMNDWPAQRVPPEAPAERTRKVEAAAGGGRLSEFGGAGKRRAK